MIETATNARMQQAFDRAHEERGAILAKMMHWLFASRPAPLRQMALTEPSRCA